MADEPPKDERTEAPTAHRREQAREKGDRPASRELATALAGGAAAMWLWAEAPRFGAGLRQSLHDALAFGHAEVVDFRPVDALASMLWPLARPLGVLALLVLVAAIAGQAATGGAGFTPANLAPDWKRLNLMAGLKRLFGSRSLVELAKAIGKTGILAAISWHVIAGAMPMLAGLAAMPLDRAIQSCADIALRLVLLLGLGLALIGAIDVPLQIRMWLQRLRMTKQDIRDEMKQQEGSAEVRHALRRMARESLKRANRSAMADATVVVTNPTHFAIALRYCPGDDSAPTIVARGRGVVAQAIRELAAEQGVAVLSYPSVARALYFTGRVGQSIRPDLYAAVATILAFVLRVGGPAVRPPDAEVPETALFDEHGRMVSAR